MSDASRPVPPTGVLTEPAARLTFTFNGRPINAVQGQSIAAALYAAGVRTFSRSFKYHRPRGLFCVSGDCPNCLMQVDGRPSVRTCIEPARLDQVVRHQNAWPSLGFDVLRIFDWLSWFLPVGFYYKRFHKPRWLWPVFERLIRRVAGLGRINVRADPESHAAVEHLHADVCVIGGGPSGLAAAAAAAEAGADVLLLEQMSRLGGHSLYDPDAVSATQPLLAAVANLSGKLRVVLETTAFGLYEGNLIGAFQGERFLKIRARQIIVCTGGRPQPLLFQNNDLPGIFLGRGVQRLARLHGVLAGTQAVVLTDNDAGHRLAADLSGLGIAVVALVDRRRDAPGQPGSWPTLTSTTVVRARGSSRLRGVEVAAVAEDGTLDQATIRTLTCDLLCVVSHLAPANELLLQAGARFRQEAGQWRVEQAVPGILAAGAAAGTLDVEAQIRQGHEQGQQAAAAAKGQPAIHDTPPRETPPHPRAETPICDGLPGKCFVCFCEDVTAKDLHRAVAEGFDGIETLKRYSTVNMGPCQGKMCGLAAAAICAQATHRDVASVGMTTSRPPAVPVELATLAAAQHHPVRRTPLHHWHHAAGARWMDAGLWKRPESYGNPAAEVTAVRTAVGLIDVSTLGKFEVIGPDAAEFLERIYVNRWSDLKEGRVRYGVMCNEDGILFDDGVGVRLGPDHYYLTATTGNSEAVYQWLLLWQCTWRMNVRIVNQTSAVAALNLAGPRARDTLARMTQMDVSAEAIPYLTMHEGLVAGTPCRLLRIGFVGEAGYEIHCPSAYVWHLWSALYEAGAEFALKLFGVEAQRILRLEKGHLIIGQDTDALSNPLEAGLEGLVRFDKPLFLGRAPLEKLRARGPRQRLVGFHMADPKLVPPEGSQIVEGPRPVGRVTSARFSPTLEKCVGLAWVPATSFQVGTAFHIRCAGANQRAVVAATPFYDPHGKRLRE